RGGTRRRRAAAHPAGRGRGCRGGQDRGPQVPRPGPAGRPPRAAGRRLRVPPGHRGPPRGLGAPPRQRFRLNRFRVNRSCSNTGGLMRAIVLDRPGRFRVAKVPDPTPGPDQIVVKVDCCGVCGTDIHIMDGEFPPTPYPITPGHEFAGTVAAVGPEVAIDLPLGAKVAVDPSLYCGYCRRCRSGRDNLCENWAAIGDTVSGAFAEYVAVPAVNAHLLPDGVDGQLGAMVEPLACAVHGLRRLGPLFGDTVVLTGAGTMGLLLLQAGAGPVTVVDRVADRLAVARKLGAAHTASGLSDLDGERFEIAVDATGVPAVVDGVSGLLDRGGRLLVFGVSPAEATISLS